jgi:hypothetical protein
LTTLCNIVTKVEAYRSQNRLTQCYNSQRFGNIGKGEAQHKKKCKRLKLGGGEAYDHSNDKAAVVT